VIRSLTTPRALGLLVVAVVLMAAMVAMGRWQFGVYNDSQRADAMTLMRRAAVPIDTALGRDQAFPSASTGVPVSVEGHYDRVGQVYVRGFPGAKDAYAVVTPLLTPTGSAVLVLRGSSPVAQAPVPAGPVRISGVLEPSQSEASPLDSRRVTTGVYVPGLVSEVRPDLYSGFVILTTSVPADVLPRVAPPLPDPSRWAGLRNLLYAVQWWVFAGFVAFMWWRIVTDASDPGRGGREAEPVGSDSVG
jgi:cytochrome oxidase assembly protein ShyY1